MKKGSTIRIDWKGSKPHKYAIYFKCTSKLVDRFIEVFPDIFTYETKRAIVFAMDEDIPEAELRQCISSALRYHKLKHLDYLGLV